MESPETEETNELGSLRESIKEAPGKIQDEFERTENSWLACFGTRLFIIETSLHSKSVREMIPEGDFQRASENLERLKERLSELKEEYPARETMPGEELRQELLDKLDILKEEA